MGMKNAKLHEWSLQNYNDKVWLVIGMKSMLPRKFHITTKKLTWGVLFQNRRSPKIQKCS